MPVTFLPAQGHQPSNCRRLFCSRNWALCFAPRSRTLFLCSTDFWYVIFKEEFYNVWEQTNWGTNVTDRHSVSTSQRSWRHWAPPRMRRTENISYSSVFNYGILFTEKFHWKYIIKLIDFVIFPGKITSLIQGCLNTLQFVLFSQGIIHRRFTNLNQRSWSFPFRVFTYSNSSPWRWLSKRRNM